MDHEPPTPFDTVGDESVEARIVAWVLSEASAFEAAELERLCEERPELLVFRRRMRALHGLLTEAETSEADHSWKLPPEKRKLLDEICGEEKIVRLDSEKERGIRSSGRRALLAIAACLVLAVVVLQLVYPIWDTRAVPATMEKSVDFMPASGGGGEPANELQVLNEAVRDQEEKVEERRKVLATIVRTKGIIYKGQDSFYGQSGVDEDQAARGALQTYNDLQTQKMQIESQVNSLLKYDSEELMRYASGLELPDNTIRNLYPQYLQATREISDLKINGLEDQHPRVLAAVENIGAMKRQLDEGVVNLRSTLQAQLSMASDRLKNVEMMKNDTHEEAIKRGLDAQDYVDAKRDFEADQQRLQQLKLKQIELGIQSQFQDGRLAANGASLPAPAAARPASPAAPAASPAKQSDNAEKEMTMSLAKTKEGFKEEQRDKQRARLTTTARAEQPAVEMESKLPELAESSKLESQPNQPATGWSGSASAGGGMGFGGGKADMGSVADSSADAEQPSAGERNVADRVVANGVTSGLRSGDQAISRNNIDAILNDPNRTAGDFVDPLASASKSERKGLEEAPAESMSALAAKDSKLTSAKPRIVPPLDELNLPGEPDAFASAAKDNDGKPDLVPTPSSDLAKRLEGNVQLRVGKDGKPASIEIIRESDNSNAIEKPQLADDSVQAANTFVGWAVQDESTKARADVKAAQRKLVDLMEEIPASENPYSTFSLNISDTSFQLAKTALTKGERPDPASIKTEQFYNAVDYGDPAPASNEPVAATVEQSAHPIIPGRNLVRVALRTGSVGRSAVQPLRLTLLVDQSGSMVREDRRASMEHALSQLGVLLTKADLVTVIGFSRTPHILAEVMTGDQSAKLSGLVNQTASEGGTNLEEAMKLAGEKAAEHHLAGAQNRIVLFTDGAANLGDANPERLAAQVKSFRQKGLAFDIAGIGADGLNDRLLSELARNGNGRYYVVGSEKNDSFAKQLAGAFRPAAENVKVQVNFNPQRVGGYKLIGFEKDRLKTEDFRNDAVDAAELAADEAGVAIYQVEPIAGGTGEIGEVSVRFRDADSKEMVERTWTIPHDSQATAFDRATPSMQLAGLSLLAAEKLKGGPMADAIDFKLLADPAASVKQFYGASARVGEMLQVIEKLK